MKKQHDVEGSAAGWMRSLQKRQARTESYGVEGPPGLVACGAAAGIVAGVALGAMVGPIGVAVGVGLGSLAGFVVGHAMSASEERVHAAEKAEAVRVAATENFTPPPPAYG